MSQFGVLSSFDHNSQCWQVYRDRLQQWFIANDIVETKDATGVKRRAILLSALSESTYKLAADLARPKELQEVPFEDIVNLLNTHFISKTCGFGERYKFYAATQFQGESYPQWAARLRGLTAHCGFLNVEEALRDHFVMGMLPGAEREKLFAQDPKELTLAKAVELAESVRSARAGAAQQGAPRADQLFKISSANRASDKVPCSVCGFKNHSSAQCRFANYTCKKCNVKGHLRRMCKKINYMENEGIGENGDDGECFNIRTFHGEPMMLSVSVQGVHLRFQIDSGSAVTAISSQTYKRYFQHAPLSPCNKRLLSYNGNIINCVGIALLPFVYAGKSHKINVYVIDDGGPPLLGRDFISLFKLGMAPMYYCESLSNVADQLQEKYSNVFSEELGTFNKYKVKLNLKKDAKPVFFKPRPVAFALRDKVSSELDRLVRVGILKPVEHSEYASPIVPVLKRDGSIRLCADYSVTINKQLLVDQYPLPTAQELFSKLHGGQQFSKLDLSQAYAQCVLDEESQKMTCINTHKGLFMYTRLVFGLASAPAIFQRVMESVLSGIEGVLCMMDDVLVTGPCTSVHLSRLHEVLRRLQDAGLTLQKTKCEFFKDEVEYLGFKINKDGLKKSPQKVNAILKTPVPKDVNKLQSFLGLINYYRNFIPAASSILSPLYNLLRKNVKWSWNSEHDVAFRTVKNILVSDQVLAHFDPDAKIILTVDASSSGLGAVLSQIDGNGFERPVSFASRTLNAAERRYSQIQKEATAIIFGVRRFHQYLYGRSTPFILRTDHKPLITIFGPNRGIPEISANRLQRYAIFLSAYNYIIEYIRSADNSADYLSRASGSDDESAGCGARVSGQEASELARFIEDRASYINFVIDDTLPVTLDELRHETNIDKKLTVVSNFILNGWPKKVTHPNICPYFLCKNQLSLENGVIMRGHKIIIPEKLQNRILTELHKSHLGIVKCKAEARSRFWFPGIDKAIEVMIGSCEICSQLRPSPARAPLASWPHPPQPFYRVHVDFLGPINNQLYLVIVDAYSKWVEAYKMSSTSSTALINKLYEFMSRFGLVHTIVSDNATCFTSDEFVNFCAVNGISHVTSPAYHPASNGQAESYVKIIKKGIKSCLLTSNSKQSNEQLFKYLFDYRNSLHSTTGSSPAQLVFGRKLRTRLDILNSDATASPCSPNTLAEVVARNQCLQSKAYGGINRLCFETGDYVMYKKNYPNGKYRWNKGIVIRKIGKTVYLVKDCVTMLTLKKHKNQLMPYKGPRNNKTQLCDTSPVELSDFNLGDVSITPSPLSAPADQQADAVPHVEGGSECNETLPTVETQPSGGISDEPSDVTGDEFFEASTDLQQDHVEHQRTGSSNMVLRSVPKVNYKQFFCIDV